MTNARYPSPLTATVYALRDIATGKYIRAEGDTPELKPLAEATVTPGRSELVQIAVDRLHPHGIHGYEIDRIEPARPFPGRA